MSLAERLHEAYGRSRRVRVLSGELSPLIPRNASLLDVGCGDGALAHALSDQRSDLSIRGIDVLVRPDAQIAVEPFDGLHIPCDDDDVDLVLLVDVLHHSEDAVALLRDAARVARVGILIKDHTLEGPLAGPTLRFMDGVGNARHGVALPHDYWTKRRWDAVLSQLGLEVEHWTPRVGLYPWPASWIFGRSLHFIARLGVGRPEKKR